MRRFYPLLWLSALGCADFPEQTADLYGLWASDDGETQRVLSFEEGDLYDVYLYPVGDTPELVQSGVFDIVEDHLVTYADDGGEYSNRFERFSSRSFTLEVDKATGETRQYDSVGALP